MRARCRAVLGAAVLGVAGWGPLGAQARDRLPVAAVESLLATGAYERARAVASRLTRDLPNDPRGFDVLGAALLTGPSPRLFEAIRAFREAARLSPRDTVAWGGMADAALRLGGADGERIARDALERLLALTPTRSQAWDDWLRLYRSSRDRARMRRLLDPSASDPRVAIRIAQLLIEEERYPSADSVLDRVLSPDPAHAAALALRAQSAFEAGDDSSGHRLYEQALRSARADPRMLWRQVVGIATPQELRAWTSGPADPEQFLRALWARRQANLFEPANSRIAEHFHRLRIARARWTLVHPLAGYQQRQQSRWLNATPSAGEEVFFQRCEVRQFVGRPGRVADAARAISMPSLVIPDKLDERTTDVVPMPGVLSLPPNLEPGTMAMLGRFNRSLLDLDTTAVAVGYNVRTGLDDRGLVFLRFGEPLSRMIGSPNVEDPFCAIPDLEVWNYEDIGAVRFFRPTAVSVIGVPESERQTGDIVLRPMNEPQFTTAALAVTRDATSVAAPLSFGAWFAQLRGTDPQLTEIVVATTRGAVAAELAPEDGLPGGASESPSGVVALAARAGRAMLTVHVLAGDSLGRQALPVVVRSFSAGPAVSDMLVARPWGDTVVTRAALLASLSRDLTFEVGARIRVAVEIYSLRRAPDGQVGYRAVYLVARSDQPTREMRQDGLSGATVLSFEQQRRSIGDVTVEWVDIDTDRLDPGRYVLRLDLSADGRHFGRAQAAITLVEPHPS